MILRSGVDIIEITRFEEQRPEIRKRFLARVFTVRELSLIRNSHISAAGRFAAKEAVAKALGCGIGKVRWQDIEILQGKDGEPLLILHAKAEEISQQAGLKTWSLSISHSRQYAIAFAVAVGTS
ncbi:MAG TPA: holo-ACP synthase [Anaerolineaceae bacterium]|jgi:holo-[acyl-carrier protein] synthase|nr:holo-ACP synthase [Anaerolineaceae bacterium]